MYLYGLLALASFTLARPYDEWSSAKPEGHWGGCRPWSPSSASVPAQGDHHPTSTVNNGWHPSGKHSGPTVASPTGAPSWSLPSAGPDATVLPLRKRINPSPSPYETPSGWGDWKWSSSSSKYASTSKSTSSKGGSTSTTGGYVSSTTSYLSSTTKASTASTRSASTTLSTLTTTKVTTSGSNSAGSSTTSVSTSGSTSTTSSKTSTSSGSFETTLLNPLGNLLFTLDVTIGDTAYELTVDTGSSDTWAHASVQPAGFEVIPNEYLYIEYADQTYALGPLGNDSVTLAGLTVPEQTISIVDQSTADRPPNSVGLIGLSFNALTSEYFGQEPTAANRPVPRPAPDAQYSSIMNTIFNVDNLTPPLFSLALSRDPDEVSNSDQFGGVFVIGGEPDLTAPTINVTTPIASTPMTDFNNSYLIAVDSVSYGNQVLDQGVQYLVDSGTTLVVAPDASVAAYYAQFSPAPDSNGNVACNTPVPAYGVTIGGQTFFVNPADILRPTNVAGTCSIGIVPTGDLGINILGDVFMMNVLAVFDWGAEEIRFGGREYYSVPT